MDYEPKSLYVSSTEIIRKNGTIKFLPKTLQYDLYYKFKDSFLNTNFEENYYMFLKILSSKLNIKYTFWNNYDVVDFTQIPFPNANILQYCTEDEDLTNFAIVKIDKPSTWSELWILTEKLVKKSQDLILFPSLIITNFFEDELNKNIIYVEFEY